MALHVAGIEYEHREVLLRDKPAEMLEASPKGSVPVFLTQGEVIDESIDIMAWALPGAKIDEDIVAMIDGPFKHHLDRYKYASRYDPKVKRGEVNLSHRAKAVQALQALENKLDTEPFLAGNKIGPSDMAAFPFVRQFAAVQPDWWCDEERLNKTRGWLALCMDSDIFKVIMEKHPVWSPTS